MIDRQHPAPGVMKLTLTRPAQRNALSIALLDELADTIETLGSQTIVIDGAGPGFTAGADFNEVGHGVADLAVDEAVTRAATAIQNHPAPVIAAVHGYCVGAGVALVSACDLVIADHHTWFQVPATRLGLLYDPTAVRRMAGRVSLNGLAVLLLTGDRIDAVAAQRVGLVDLVVQGAWTDEAVRVAQAIVANDPAATTATKKLLRELRDDTFQPDAHEQTRRELLASPARHRAVAATRTGETT